MKKRILMIDDDPQMHRIVGLYLKNQPFKLESVTSARMALHKLEEQRYDLILSDIQMPGMDGIELIKTIKEKFPDMPVMVLSAYGSDQFEKELGELSHLRVVAKPFDQSTLVRVILDILK